MNVYDSSTEIADAGDISNHVKLLEVHCTFAHAIGVQNASGTGQFPSRTARIPQLKVVLSSRMGQFKKKIGNSSFIAGQNIKHWHRLGLSSG